MNELKQSDKAKITIQFYWRYLRRYPRWLVGVVFSLPFTVLINNYLPALIAASVLSRLSQHDFISGQVWRSFGPELAAYAGLLLFGVLTCAWSTISPGVWKPNVGKDIADDVFCWYARQKR